MENSPVKIAIELRAISLNYLSKKTGISNSTLKKYYEGEQIKKVHLFALMQVLKFPKKFFEKGFSIKKSGQKDNLIICSNVEKIMREQQEFFDKHFNKINEFILDSIFVEFPKNANYKAILRNKIDWQKFQVHQEFGELEFSELKKIISSTENRVHKLLIKLM